MAEKKNKCRLCGKYYSDSEMSEEHYPAHSVGNDDIVALNLVEMLDSFINTDLHDEIKNRLSNQESFEGIADDIFDNRLTIPAYPKGRTARTLCKKCNTFLGKYDESYLKFFNADGNPKIVKGFQNKTKIEIIKAIYAKFLSVPEANDENFDFIEFIQDQNATEYHGVWNLFLVKRDYSTDLMGLCDIRTGKLDYEDGVVYELSDDKFIFNLMNFDLPSGIQMTNMFDILNKNYTVISGLGELGGFHAELLFKHLFQDNGIDE